MWSFSCWWNSYRGHILSSSLLHREENLQRNEEHSQQNKDQENIQTEVILVPLIFQILHFLIYHHGNKQYCVDIHIYVLDIYIYIFLNRLFLVQSDTERGEHVQMPQRCSLAEQVEACSTLLPIYSTNMGRSAFTECLLLGEPAPSC